MNRRPRSAHDRPGGVTAGVYIGIANLFSFLCVTN